MNCFFDNASSVSPTDRVLERFMVLALELFANQESASFAGSGNLKRLKEAEKILSSSIAPGSQVFWANTGTDTLASAVRVCASAFPKGKVLTTDAEHPALSKALERGPWKIVKVRLQRDGAIAPEALKEALDPSVVLAAFHHVNSETGRIQDLAGIRRILDEAGSRALFLADTMQSACKIPIPWEEARLDFAQISGCKISSPGGAALLYRENAKYHLSEHFAEIRGKDHASGRCPASFCILLSEIVPDLISRMKERAGHVSEIREYLSSEIKKIAKVTESVPSEKSSPYILHFVFEDYQGAILVRALHQEKISAAAGSACMSETPEPSHTLRAMGFSAKRSFGAFRLSFWDDSDMEGAKHFAKVLFQVLKNY